MGSIKIKIHPLTFAFWLFYVATGRLGVFIVYTLTALIHELGHSIVASKCGYSLGKICLMPFGAVVSGEHTEFSPKDEIKIALAGPLVNLSVGLFFTALWWIFPETYTYTDICAEANFVLAFINFLPAYPLDGGRVLCASMSLAMKRKRAHAVAKWVGITFSLGLLGLFVASCFYTINVSLLFFALFVFFGATSREKDNVYVRILSFPDKNRLKKGVLVKRWAVDRSTTIKELMSILDANAINEVAVYDVDKEVKTLSQLALTEMISKGDLYAMVGKYV